MNLQAAAEAAAAYDRLIRRNPQHRDYYEKKRKEKLDALAASSPPGQPALESVSESPASRALRSALAQGFALETIVSDERPVLYIQDGLLNVKDVTILGPDAQTLVDLMDASRAKIEPLLPLVGRFDVTNYFNHLPFLGTGWFVTDDIIVTNRHVASLIAKNDGRTFEFRLGMGGQKMAGSLNTAHEFDDAPASADRVFKITEVLYIEADDGANDIAFVRVARKTTGLQPGFIPLASADVGPDVPVCLIGYPARAPENIIPDQALMRRLYLDRYDIKRASPGYTMEKEGTNNRHDCTSLGGSSGSVLVELATGKAVGLHFSGLYKKANYTVPISVLNAYVKGSIWNKPVQLGGSESPVTPPPAPPPPPVAAAAAAALPSAPGTQTLTLNVPLTITVSVELGQPVGGLGSITLGSTPAALGAAPATRAPLTPGRVAQAAADYWHTRPAGVLAVRVGYLDDGDEIGDQPCLAVSVPPAQWETFEARSPREFEGVPLRYYPAEVGEQIDALPQVESVTSIAYDDDARTGTKFSFDPVEEVMEVLLHVGPEFSWDALHDFLGDSKVAAIDKRIRDGQPLTELAQAQKGVLVSAMYEFHGTHIKDALEARLEAGSSLSLVLDNASFSKVKVPAEEFDRAPVFQDWAQRFKGSFSRIVAPEGTSGLISDSYHIKVTVRDDDTFWLSSGNWKMGSSQPIITPAELAAAAVGQKDLHGNREWHVVIQNKTLAARFRNHILQDFKCSQKLGGVTVPVPKKKAKDPDVDVPLEETLVLERPAPSGIVLPQYLKKSVKVQPLLTPDQQGAVYSEAVLHLIRHAKKSLLFQIPYISIPSSPDADRGYIDELLAALIKKLKTLPDARVILRSGSSAYSSPTHAAWYFKSQGVDIGARLRLIDDSHTKGMIVDSSRALIGSHNWSAPGVTLNRDASLIFDDSDVAAYYTQAFEIDWARSRLITPKKYVKTPKPESTLLEAVGARPPAGYVRMPISEWKQQQQ